MLIKKIVNEDGTDINPPQNPLKEKWDKLYPAKPMPQYSQVCDGYSCISCTRCPRGGNWEVPEEDRVTYEKYLTEYQEYMLLHNPSRRKEMSTALDLDQ